MKTRFAYLEKDHVAKVGEREIPDEPHGHQVIVRMLGNNLCTTDYQQWMGLREHQGYPMAGGHEGEAVVEMVGEDVKTVKPGDFVAFGYVGCGVCENCRAGLTNLCTNRPEGRPVSEDGYIGQLGMSEHRIVTDRELYVMNPELEACEAGFLEPVATVCNGIRKLRLKPHEYVVVVGAGTMGLANAQVARAFGGRVIISELMENKIETAKSLGFEVVDSGKEDLVERVKEFTNGNMADAVILAVSNKFVIDQSYSLLKRLDGRILLFAAGYPAPKTELDANMIHYRRIDILGTFGSVPEDFSTSAMLLNTRTIDVRPMCEPNQHPLDDIQGAFEEAATPGKFRVHVKITDR